VFFEKLRTLLYPYFSRRLRIFFQKYQNIFPLKISHVMSGQIFQKTDNSKIEISQKAKNTP
jgi:hypothetical protein